MAALDWATPRTALAAALAALSSTSSPGYLVGRARLDNLDAVGEAYDADYTLLSTRLSAEESAYDDALLAWSEAMAAPWSYADRACRYVEGKQYARQLGRVLTPRRIANGYGTEFVLAGDTYALPLSGGVVTEEVVTEAMTRASASLLASGGAPVLVVKSAVDGYAGRFITTQVSAASDGVASHFKLTLARGVGPDQFVEVYDNLDCTVAQSKIAAEESSLLAASITQTGLGRPVNSGATAMTGGTGGLYDAVTNRFDRLSGLVAIDPDLVAVTAEDIAVLDSARALFERAWNQMPARRNALDQRESELRIAIASAEHVTDYLNSGLG